MRRKIDVTAGEMLELRKQGLSNHDIARCLDISEQTVRRYIGNQNRHMERLAAFADTPPKRKEMEVKDEMPMIPKYEPKPFKESYGIGDYAIELSNDDRLVTVSSESGDIVLAYEDIPDLVQFFAWAMRTRMEVTADAANTEVQKQGGESERGEV